MSSDAIAAVQEVTGCSRESAARAVEAAGDGGLDLAVDLVLSATDSQWASADISPPPTTNCKMVALVRTDLGMGVGKIAAQVSHATLGAFKAAKRQPPTSGWLEAWETMGEPTIVLAVASHAELDALLTQAEQSNLIVHRVADAGRTEVAPGTVTVGVRTHASNSRPKESKKCLCCLCSDVESRYAQAIGPAAVGAIDAVTGKLSLL